MAWHRVSRRATRRRGVPVGDRQRGVVLVVAMLMLLVLTLLGTTGLATATLELRMAANRTYQERAFAAAEYGIEQAIHAAELSTSITYANPAVLPVSGPAPRMSRSPQDFYSYRLYYDTSTAVPADAVAGSTDGSLKAYHFVVEATGRSERGATDTHVQGFYVVDTDPPPATLRPPACATGCSGTAMPEPKRTFWMQKNVD